MAIQYKADVLALLKAAGYPSTRIRAEKLLGQSYVQQLRKGASRVICWSMCPQRTPPRSKWKEV